MNAQILIRSIQSLAMVLAMSGVAQANEADDGSYPGYELADSSDYIQFPLDRAAGIVKAGCLPDAWGEVKVTAQGPVQVLEVSLSGVPADTEYKFFITQVPNAPFGLSWYQGGVKSDADGYAYGVFVGRFNAETFIIAPDVQPAPVVHGADPFPDANANPKTDPIHTFHIGIWFPNPDVATAAGCPGTVTPFSGKHAAGVLLFNTGSFPNDAGPLFHLKP